MRRTPAPASALTLIALLLSTASCGGGDGGTPPETVSEVLITAPATAPSFQTLGRTVQFAASAVNASDAPIAGATITWQSTVPGVASVNGSGLVTAVANGTTTVTAHSGGVASTGVAVTVAQVVDTVLPNVAAVLFGAIGSTRQLTASAVDSSDASVPGTGAATWTRVGSGTVADVSAGGLVTALAVGNTDTAVATIGAKVARVPITVTQVIATVIVSPTPPETLRTTGRTKQYAAIANDSQGNLIPGASFGWSSSASGTATVDPAGGLATAVSDGNTAIIATAGGISGQRTLVVRRYAETFTMTPSAASITTNAGVQVFNGNARDSVDTVLPISWVTRNSAIASINPLAGASTTATAEGNGTVYVVMSAGTRLDSALVTVSGQVVFPSSAAVEVSNFQFQSNRNSSTSPATDTVAVGGTVTWTWAAGSTTHNVTSTGSPNFPSSNNQATGTFVRTFLNVGDYDYVCSLHGGMTGRIVVR